MRHTILFCLLLTACSPQFSDPDDYNGVPTCGAADLQYLLGRPEAALAEIDLPAPSRVLRPGDIITLEFSPDRLTIDIDEAGRISSVTCR
ncbi:I78 family peptidase inhibitor [Litoreibacter roseus]|uniref:Peptidase inhibitor I78 family protein n=1 Tax=Litoreibacter roseus TaxID=2601869 RepID=A0A6N6JDR8_9RHOB|nr:I78 family peptidase inhibitor [Litoreibacter roseus]GFE64473.1 hypothetical protein KIN_15470 [Litoreibacter roseus]